MNVPASLKNRELSDCITQGQPLQEMNLRRRCRKLSLKMYCTGRRAWEYADVGFVHSGIASLYFRADKQWTSKVHTGITEQW
ncbi:hypothetical protein T4D_13039 [Trichinella pseudospiralis]|uniref:Uncharacterized protein n=1 Tax=Trichinella pseudospiralis TaxID=6337 RepID=A0A0V1FEJ3_TRIPS|nr:hypothetical protein T4D_13039 [Trichinella pseudospiralis]